MVQNGLRRCRQLLEYLVMTMEASRKDWLKDLELTANVGPSELWARVS